MRTNSYPKQLVIAANQKIKEKNYWLKKLSGISGKSSFSIIQRIDEEKPGESKTGLEPVAFNLSGEAFQALTKLSKKDDRTLHVILAAGVIVLLYRYTGSDDIVVGTPIYKQNIDADIINTILPLRIRLEKSMSFKEVLLQVRNTLVEATENYSYPVELLPADLGLPFSEKEFPIFDVAFLLTNIHDRSYLRRVPINILFSFTRKEGAIEAVIDYNPRLYTSEAVQSIGNLYQNLARQVFSNVDVQLDAVEILSEEEKRQILVDFNDTEAEYSQDKTLHALFEEQTDRTPDSIALVLENQAVTYKRLNQQANRLAHLLRGRGVTRETPVAVILEPSIDLMVSILGILKAGGAYLPIPPGYPPARVLLILDDNNVLFVIADTAILKTHSITELADFKNIRVEPFRTASRPLSDFDSLPVPDRSLLDYEKYNRYIGHAMVKNTLSFQGTRGCPYNCSYCHRIWPRAHVVRSAENIFSEMMLYYNMGIRRFSFIDDIFNLDIENSTKFFRMIIRNGLKVQLFFPNGLRGDTLTKDYIDLMVEAGTVNIDLALETASPRLQKLIGKNLNIEKLKENIDYICQKHPHVILDFNAMYGFPSETEEEAMMTMEFIKNVKWIHFTFVFILKIHPNTGIGNLALQHGISHRAIMRSMNYSYHDVPETLPFPKRFARNFQAKFLKEYFLLKERLLHVLPYQMKIATENELVQKYNNYLPTEINSFTDIIEQVGISRDDLGEVTFLPDNYMSVPDLNRKIKKHFPVKTRHEEALRILLLDLSELFSSEEQQILHGEIVEPTGLLYVLTYLNKKFSHRVYGKAVKSRIDFDSHRQLKRLIADFNPHLIGIRTLSYYKDFFHRTVSMIRNWGVDIPIVSGGPYATMDYPMILQDLNVDAAVLGEGELTFAELVGAMLDNNKKFPSDEQLKKIQGIAFIPGKEKLRLKQSSRYIVWLDKSSGELQRYPGQNPENFNQPGDLLYLISTSGSTGAPKSVMLEHRNLGNLVHYQYTRTGIDFGRVLQFASIGFDVSAQEIFSTLLYGGELYLIPGSMKSDILNLFDYINKNRINTLFLPPAFLRYIFSDPEYAAKFPGKVGNIVTAGEQLTVTEPLRIYLQRNHVCLYNHYGPTETHVVTSLSLEPGVQIPELPPIGKPIANTRAFILGKHGNVLPIGAPGELYISGDNVGRGYCNRQELTHEKFSPELPDGDGRRYRTGDAARWLANGNIQFLGRVDQQVKIRGYRIELGEIENRLQEYDEIKKAVVEVVSGKRGGRAEGSENQLYAYIVTETGLDTIELRKYLSTSLPDYMIPAKFVQLKQIPLTANGKIDRNALHKYETVVSSGTFHAPRDETERKLAGIWADVLEMDNKLISIDDDFFDLGGHSLKATILLSQLHRIFDVKLSLGEMFRRPTILELSGYIREAAVDKYSSITPAEEKEYYPVSSVQKRLYLLQQMDMETIGYNLPYVVTLDTSLGRESLRSIFIKLIDRHESLRTSFEMIAEQPVQRIHREVPFEIGYSAPEYNAQVAVEDIIHDFIRPFNLSHAPLMRVKLVKTTRKGHILMLDMHHIITDGTSQNLLITEFMALSTGENLPALRLQYKDFSQWQNSGKQREFLERQETFWLKEFTGVVPVINLPIDYPRPAFQSFAGRTIAFSLNREETSGIKQLVRQEKVTLYMVLLTIYNIFLAKLSNQEDIVVGTDTAGRKHPDLENIIGMFVNTLPLRNYPAGEQSVTRFLVEVKDRTLNAFENQEYPFEDLVDKTVIKRDASRNPLFDVMFAFQNIGISEEEFLEKETLGRNPKPFPFDDRTAKFDLTLNGQEKQGMLFFSFEYCRKLFKQTTIERFIRYFKAIVNSVIRHAGEKISAIEIISATEKQQILWEFNNTGKDIGRDTCYDRLFEEQVARTPDRIAALHNEKQISYLELDKEAGQVANLLSAHGVMPGTLVGVYMERGIRMLASIIGIFKSGGVYLPLEINQPAERIKNILEDSEVPVLITKSPDLEVLRDLPGDLPLLQHQRCTDDPAYIIYTSGTTGKPKGVIIHQLGMINHLYAKIGDFSITGDDIIAQTAAVSFDISVWQFLSAPLLGGCTVVIDRDTVLDPDVFLKVLQTRRVTILESVPSLMRAFLEMVKHREGSRLNHLRWMIATGEALGVPLAREWCRCYPRIKLVNAYGPTEASDDVTHYVVNEMPAGDQRTISIGKPLQNLHIYILDKHLNLCPVGVRGEICVAGIGVGKGYLKDAKKTAKSFLANPFMDVINDDDYKTIYKTGDIGYFKEDGNLECLGRLDHQVKIRGNRIELGEIENCLSLHRDIYETVVMAREDKSGMKYLCAYLVLHPSSRETFSVSGLRDYLAVELPDYMVPSYFVQLDKIPLTANGKVDRKLLPEPEVNGTGEVFASPRDEIEKTLLEIWSAVLEIEINKIGIDTNFFEVGGHSLKAAILVSRVHKELGVKVPLAEIFKEPTIKGSSVYIKKLAKEEHSKPEPVEKREYYALSSAQKRLYIIQQREQVATTYNMPTVVVLEADIEKEKLEKTFRKLIERHESLRTSFLNVDGEPVQRVSDAVPFELEYYCVENKEAGEQLVGNKEKVIIGDFMRPFDLRKPPLLRAGLIKQDVKKSVLMIDIHHIITDGISDVIFLEDFLAFYRGEELTPLNLQYKDFSEWQSRETKTKKLKQREEYWLKEFEGELAVLELPGDYPRPAVQSFAGSAIEFTMDLEIVNALKNYAKEQGATLYMVLLSLLYVLFSKLSGQEDIVIGTVTAGRGHADLERVMGMFVNTLPLRNFPAGEKSYGEFLWEVKERVLKAFDNQDYPFEVLVENVGVGVDLSRHPLFGVGFVLQNQTVNNIKATGINFELYKPEHRVSRLDLTFNSEERGDGLFFMVEYCTKLFKEKTIKKFIKYFNEIARLIIKNGNIQLKDIKIAHSLISADSTMPRVDFGV